MTREAVEALTDEQLRIKVAELLGYRGCHWEGPSDGREFVASSHTDPKLAGYYLPVHDYPRDLNAMHEAEEFLGIDMEDMAHRLWTALCALRRISDREAMRRMMHATARQRAEAFVLAMEA